MKVTVAFVSGLFALNALAAPQEETAATTTRELSPTETCLAGCSDTDLNCKAACVGVPNPDEDGVNETTECEAACDQGDGSAEDTQAFADCKSACYTSYFFSSGTAAAATGTATAAADSDATPTESAAEGEETGADPTDAENSADSTDSEQQATETESSAEATSTETGAASSNAKMGASAAGIAGIVMALFAL